MLLTGWAVSALFFAAAQCSGVLSALILAKHKEANDQEHHCSQDLGQSPDFSLFRLFVAHFVSRNWVVVSGGIGGCVGFFAIALLSRHLLCAMAP